MLEKEVKALLTMNLHTLTLKDSNEQKSTFEKIPECLRQKIVEELKKTELNLPLIRKMMQTTFAMKRSEELPTSEGAHGPLACSKNGV